ncbi:T9SS type A sorting domain-containing protein [Chishuiella sp.]|uniref:T9SS type A sorting domain-containing protein n=1 Tax=Chishuiella sp. TaxID=1969467 RepID=UPI0028A5EC9C|nr:T9SS type A sorting domain-containing protein [Chishuiella sp.]
MKKLLLFILVLLNGVAFGQNVQGDSKYKLSLDGWVGHTGSSSCGSFRGLQWITAFYQNGNHQDIFGTYNNREQNYSNASINFDNIFYTKNNILTKLNIRTTARRGNTACTSYENTGSPNISFTMDRYYDFEEFEQKERHIPGYVTIKSLPIVTLNTPDENNRLITNEKYLNIQLADNIDNSYYNWEYSVGNPDNFIRFPDQYNNQPILNLKGDDFLKNNDLGKSIFIRVNTGYQNNTSNIILFTYLKTAPKITSASSGDITCFGEENGQVTLNFDRKLEEGETLESSLVNTDNGNAVVDNYNLSSLSNATSYTISGLAKGNYRLDLAQGTYGGNPTYTDGADYSYTFTIKEPKPVEFSVTQSTDVFCYDGSDGTINLSATGEAGRTFKYSILGGSFTTENWVNFSSASTTKIENLPAGEYTIKVMDSSGCLAKNGDTIKEVKVKITQPDAPLSVVENEIMLQQPTGYGLSNGLISVRIVGGTKNDDGSYDFEWRKDSPSGEIISSSQIVTDATNNPFTIVLKDIPSGKYYLTVKDKNYSNALNGQEGCGIISREFFVDQPLPLVAKLSIKEEILCHIENEYYGNFDRDNNNIPDQAETGIIQSEVLGGVGSYKYQWYKNDNGSFIILQNETLAELSKVIAGEYKLEVVDENKNKTETELIINSPEKLIVNTKANELICNSDNGGVITATAIGGSGDYTYLWNTSDITSTVTGLTAGNYFVTIKDKNNCVATNSVTIKEPSSFEVEVVQQINPTCFDQANGLLEISISGGTYPYLIEWSNGMKGALISGLKAGAYTVTITDESGCQTIKTYMLTEPEETKVNLGKDVTLCLGDSIDYDVTSTDANATYEWLDKKGNIISTSAKISLNLPGEYTVKITNESGCVSTDSVIITSSSAILQPEFLIATHAFVDGNVKLVNSSKIIPERVEWIFPSENDYKIISESTESLEIKFSKIGKYQFGLKGYQGLCEKTFYKEILVEENTNGIDINPKSISNIKEFIVTPNPNNGNYKVFVKLYEAKPIRIRIIDMLAQEFYVSSEFIKNTEFEIPFHQSLVSGAYFVVLETEGEILVRRMLIK